MEEDDEIAMERAMSIADVVQLEVVSKGVEVVGEAGNGRFGEIPELVLC